MVKYPANLPEALYVICESASSLKVVESSNFYVACVPLEEEYASSFLSSRQVGVLAILYSKDREKHFIYMWLGGVLVVSLTSISLGLVLLVLFVSELHYNLFNLGKVLNLSRKVLSKEKTLAELRNSAYNFTIKEFFEVGKAIFNFVREILKLNGKIKRLALKDRLTGLYNRNYISLFVESKLLPILQRQKANFTVALLDLDNFKFINDNFGHQKGDEVLKKWAEIIKKELRISDIPIRFGGEEILIIFPYTSKEKR